MCSVTFEISARPRCDNCTHIPKPSSQSNLDNGVISAWRYLWALGGFNSCGLFCFSLFFLLLESSFASNELTHTRTNIGMHVKPKQPAIKHAASRGGVTQALSEKRCRAQIWRHCCRRRGTEAISRKEKHLSSRSEVSPTLAMNGNYSFRRPPERMTESLIEEMLHKQPESCSIHSSFPSSSP